MDSYKYVVITFMRPKSNPSKIIKLIKNQNLIMSIIGEYVFARNSGLLCYSQITPFLSPRS